MSSVRSTSFRPVSDVDEDLPVLRRAVGRFVRRIASAIMNSSSVSQRQSGAFLIVAPILFAVGCSTPSLPRERDAIAAEVADRTDALIPLAPIGKREEFPPNFDLNDGVDEDEAVALALWRNADLEVAMSELGFARADLARAGLLKNPMFSLLFPWGPKQLEATLTFSIEALWLREERIAAARLDAESLASRLVASALDVVRDVRLAYTELERLHARRTLFERRVEIRRKVLAESEARARHGEAPAGVVDFERARCAEESILIARIDADIRTTEIAVAQLLGGNEMLRLSPSSREEHAPESFDEGRLIAQALMSRPEIRAAELAVQAAASRLDRSAAETFTANLVIDANAEGSQGFESGPGLQVAFPWPGTTDPEELRARAEVERSAAKLAALRARVLHDVRSAIAEFESADRLASIDLRAAAREAVRVAEVRMMRGETTLTEESAGFLALVQADIDAADAWASRRRALIRLEHAVGRRIR